MGQKLQTARIPYLETEAGSAGALWILGSERNGDGFLLRLLEGGDHPLGQLLEEIGLLKRIHPEQDGHTVAEQHRIAVLARMHGEQYGGQAARRGERLEVDALAEEDRARRDLGAAGKKLGGRGLVLVEIVVRQGHRVGPTSP